jgi:Protein of unknown function (DUF616)
VNTRNVVYTAIFGNYDSLYPTPQHCGCDTDFVCFTDNPELRSSQWRMTLDDTHFNDEPALKNRFFKILAHRHLSGYDNSLYVDGSIAIRKCPCKLFDKYLARAPMAAPRHQDRDCSYQEAEYCIDYRRADPDVVKDQMSSYRSEGFPPHFGMTENNILLRRHGDAGIRQAMEMWWQEYSRRIRRDQISLPFILWKLGIESVELREGPRLTLEYFKIQPHRGDPSGVLKRIVWEVLAAKHRNRAYAWLARIFTYLASVKNAR